MNKKLVKTCASASMVAVMVAAMGSQVFAVEWNPSRTQSEVSAAQTTTTTSTGTTVAVSTAPAVDATGAVVQVEDSEEVIIQVTPVSATLAANAALDGTDPNAATASGLSYAANGQLNALYAEVSSAESVSQLLADTAPAAAAAFEATVGAPADAYAPMALYDIATSAGAAAAIAEGGSVDIAIAVPGVTDGTQMVAICWDRVGNSRIVPATVSGGVVTLSVTTSGPVMLMARAQ